LVVIAQYLYKYVVATSFANSREDAIIIEDITAPENNIPIPNTEKNAAHSATNNAEKPNNIEKLNIFVIYLTCSY
jgi:hypothetical protein